MLNLMDVQPGQKILLKDGTTVEVVENVGDGIWLKAKLANGEEELIFCEDIVNIVDVGQ